MVQALASGPASAAEVAAACRTAIRPTALLLDGLVALGLLEQVGEAYGLAPVARFLAGPYRDLGDSYWSHLPAFLETGKPMARMDDARESERHYQAQAMALAWMMAPAAEAAAAALDGRRQPARRRGPRCRGRGGRLERGARPPRCRHDG